MLILERDGDLPDERPPGLPDDRFEGPSEGPQLLTHADVRVVTLSRFRDLPPGPIWDVGAGLGGMAVELSRAFPAREVVAIERSAAHLSFLRANRRELAAYNLRIVAGEAPEGLASEASPAGIFLGGSGGRLGAILDLALDRLAPGGVLVANFVVLENLTACLARLRAAGWAAEVSQVQVSHGLPLAGLTAFVPLRPVWVVRVASPAIP